MALSEVVEGKMDYELTDDVANEIITAKNPEGAAGGKKGKK